MNTTLMSRGKAIVLLGLLLIGAGCGREHPNAPATSIAPPTASTASSYRGEFGPDSCSASERAAVNTAAEFAVYYDKDNNVLEGELLKGTTNNLMCRAILQPDHTCPPHTCAKGPAGTTFCIPC